VDATRGENATRAWLCWCVLINNFSSSDLPDVVDSVHCKNSFDVLTVAVVKTAVLALNT